MTDRLTVNLSGKAEEWKKLESKKAEGLGLITLRIQMYVGGASSVISDVRRRGEFFFAMISKLYPDCLSPNASLPGPTAQQTGGGTKTC